MSENKTDPNEIIHPTNAEWHSYGGLTKREYFAAMALQGLLSNSNVKDELLFGETSVKLADVLIRKLNEKGPNEKP